MQYLDREELKTILRTIPDPRNRLMVLVTFWHGLRNSEVIGLRGADIRDGRIYCKRLKGSMETVQRFVKHEDPELDEAKGLTELAATLKDDDLVFPITRSGFYKLMKRTAGKAGFPKSKKVRPHILKHSIAMQTIKSGGIEMVRQRLGHQSIASTGHYLKVTDDEAAEAIERAMR